MLRSKLILPGMLLLLLTGAPVIWPQATPNFSGSWKQDNERCEPKRSGDVTLSIEHHEAQLTVETTVARNSSAPHHAIQKYTTDGKVSVSTGADGDEFRTSVVVKDSALVLSIEEHEDGRVLLSKETWSLTGDGTTLKKVRERQRGGKQILFFRRLPSEHAPLEHAQDQPSAAATVHVQ